MRICWYFLNWKVKVKLEEVKKKKKKRKRMMGEKDKHGKTQTNDVVPKRKKKEAP